MCHDQSVVGGKYMVAPESAHDLRSTDSVLHSSGAMQENECFCTPSRPVNLNVPLKRTPDISGIKSSYLSYIVLLCEDKKDHVLQLKVINSIIK